MTNPANDIKLKCNADIFVNDNTLMHNDPQGDVTPHTLMTNIQHNAETWSRLLWVSGGFLEFLKSTYFLLIWAFAASGQPMIIPKEDLPTNVVQLTDANSNSTVLHRVSASKGIKMLGIYKAVTLNETKELDYLLNKAATYTSAACTCPLQVHEL
eukprot:8738777-Ditylum_brightwellii.AAC.1